MYEIPTLLPRVHYYYLETNSEINTRNTTKTNKKYKFSVYKRT